MSPTRSRPLALATLALAWAAPPAAATHWPQAGGDAGRSGYQPVGDGAPPVSPLWTAAGDVATSIVVTGGRLEAQRVVYGTTDGRVHLRELATGAPAGPPEGIPVEEEGGTTRPFADDAPGAAPGFAAGSGPGGGELVFVPHNADNVPTLREPTDDDVELAVVDARSGALTHDVRVAGTAGHRVSGPAVLSSPDATGVRFLLFVASVPGGRAALFSVPVDAAGAPGTARSVEVPGALPGSSPAVVHVPGSGAHAAVAGGDGVRTFSLSRFPEPGPRSVPSPGRYGTPVVPVADTGLTPGQEGSGASHSPSILVTLSDPLGERVLRLGVQPDGLPLTGSSEPLGAALGPTPAVAQEVVAGTPAAGWVVAPAANGLRVLDARSLRATARRPLGGAGFASSAPAALGRLAFAATETGAPVAVDLSARRVLGRSSFTPHAGHDGSRRSLGGPAISRGLVLLGSDRGVFAYRTRCGNPIGGTAGRDRLDGGVPGDSISGYGGRDAIEGRDGDDCLDGGPGRDAVVGGAGNDLLAGGDGSDRVDGGNGADSLSGGSGRDLLLGGAGNDRLGGGRSPDRMDGGRGNDRLNSHGGGHDRVRCGPGRDEVLVDRGDSVTRDCERVLRR